jgi:hypothetical protein
MKPLNTMQTSTAAAKTQRNQRRWRAGTGGA